MTGAGVSQFRSRVFKIMVQGQTRKNPRDLWPKTGDPICPVCEETIGYYDYRKYCNGCQTWVHFQERRGPAPHTCCRKHDRKYLCTNCFWKDSDLVGDWFVKNLELEPKDKPDIQILFAPVIIESNDPETIADHLDLPPEFVQERVQRLHDNGVWQGEAVCIGSSEEEKHEWMSIILAVLCMQGLVENSFKIERRFQQKSGAWFARKPDEDLGTQDHER